MQICVQTAQAFIIHISGHVLDDVSTNVVYLVDAIDFHKAGTPDLRKVNFLQIRQIANHVVVNRTTSILVLELDDRHVFEIRVPVLHAHDELAEVLIASLYVLDVERHLVIERKGHKLGTAIEVTAYQLPDAVSSSALSVLVVMLCISTISITLSAAFGIQFFIPPNLDNPFRDNDFLVVFFRIFSPHFSADSQRIIKSSRRPRTARG